ncbi:MAG TPA: uracil-DNA glycosylase [Chloroflexota bacterium]|jgi:uracil-DNA glycosylase family 4
MSDRFGQLVEAVQSCRRCPTMEGRRRVLGASNGRLDARVLFVAEAPGRLGGDRTGVPLTSDRTGRNFGRLLEAAGLGRDEVFVTNAVLCNPRSGRGLNRPPSRAELASCREHLRRTLELVPSPLVVSLGAVALQQLEALAPHGLTLRSDVGRLARWGERWLVPLYHPGPRAQLHRSFARQQNDFRALSTILLEVCQYGASPTSS